MSDTPNTKTKPERPNNGNSASMHEMTTGPLYDAWASIYDHSFGQLVKRRQRIAIKELQAKPGDRVLDLGVGTGMTLRHYPEGVQVVGMDLSGGMLDKANQKKTEDGLNDVELVQGDAMLPPFAPQSFDHILITHVISVVSDPQKLMAWAARLVKPTGRIVLLNHFQSANAFVAKTEAVTNPLFVKIGWRSDLSLDECLPVNAESEVPLYVHERFKLAVADFWQIVVLSPEPAPERQTRRVHRSPFTAKKQTGRIPLPIPS